MRPFAILVLYVGLFSLNCRPKDSSPVNAEDFVVKELRSPAGEDSGQPNLAGSNGQVYLSWIEKDLEDRRALFFSYWNGKSWSSKKAVISGVPFFVNWADFPSLLVLNSGFMAAHWLEKKGTGTYSYDVRISTSDDAGSTWGSSVLPYRHSVDNEHGFVSLFRRGEKSFSAAWLDARKFKQGSFDEDLSNEMMLMHSSFVNGRFSPEEVLDDRVCDCCQTSAASLNDGGAIVVYRDRTDEEVRDINYVKLTNGVWSKPVRLHPDNWKIAACPVNGPAVSTHGENVAVAWFTAANNEPKVQIKLSNDDGETFGAPVEVDDGNPAGRVDVEWLNQETAIVCWMENTTGKGAEVRIRKISLDGSKNKSMAVAISSGARSSGFPKILHAPGGIILAWTDPSINKVRIALLIERG